ncbi:MAG TPA: hypothetical protein RMH85_08670 [Polyangiaceae bacterium LLY-WYZ-15_(1-7)]|nr:hypothetical protein [Myxococcales bacterium]MAT30025.1 hypothetical protein [Sandaracinus sp.]HJL01425.1 hypothetical protein [Polyangiaceae bacterium LLY-WYZ-15_(1-7)]MBJ70880.1 hypothetical protein [Sandaracinus sp.]HJL08556.1 hypothetical protein [Polyangiaceae bacterium LLY-WYZ-15_(1-7)]
MAWLVLLVAGLAGAAPTEAQRAVRGDGIAAIVGATTPRADATVLLHSDVDLRARLRLTRELSEVPTGPLPAGLLRATLGELVGEALIAREAQRVQVATPTEADVREERRRLEGLAGGADRLRAVLEAVGASEREIDAMAERRALVRVFLEANLEGSARVSDEALERAFEAGEHPFIGQELEDVREPMRVWLGRRRMAEAVERWVQVLRTRTPVRILAAYAAE